MNKRVIAILTLLVIIPLGLLAWLGVRVASDEERQIKQAFEEVLQSKMREIDAQIQTLFDAYHQRLSKIANAGISPDALYDSSQKTPFVSQFFAQASDGRLLYPPVAGDLTESEASFLKRTQKIFDGKIFFASRQETFSSGVSVSPPRSGASLPDVNNGLRELYAQFRASDPVKPVDYGWFAWHWDSDIHILYWNRKQNSEIFGAELSRSSLISDIIGLLPENFEHDPLLNNAGIILRDSNNRLIHRLGGYVPQDAEKPFSIISLSNPLHTWSFQFYLSPAALPSRLKTSTGFNLFLSLMAVGLTLIGLAAFLFRESNREFQEAQQRVSFVNQVSHELKTPLTNIRMFAELLEKNLPEDDPEIRKKLNVIVSESQRLSRLIANVLTFSKKQPQKLSLKTRLASPDEIISGTIESFRPSLTAKGITIATDLSAKIPVIIDPDVTEQILGNLFSNIEKYAGSGGQMLIKSQSDESRTRIFIRDFGPGIPVDKIEFVFQPFTRLSDNLSEGVSGTGIGLPIARDLARLHDGDVRIIWSNGPLPCENSREVFREPLPGETPRQAIRVPNGPEAGCPGFPRVEGVCFEVTLSTPAAKGDGS